MPTMSRNARDFYSLKRDLLREGRLFVDEEFPASNRSIVNNTAVPTEPPAKTVIWKRPKDIVTEGKPRFITDGLSRFDLDQGKLGDCYFVAAAASLVVGNREQFMRVVPPDQTFDSHDYAGIFRFNFWHFGTWTEVIVDDFLPTNGTRLIYCRNREEPNEFWCALLEKAYAKLHGSYAEIVSGKVSSAFVDMTGGVAEIIKLTKKYSIPDDLYELMLKTSKMNTVFGAGIFKGSQGGGRMENGLYRNHGYSITSLAQIPYQGKIVKLLRFRNPHGRKEWSGPWSDESPEMLSLSADVKEKYEMELKDEGEFWMSYEDFIKHFDELNMCHIEPDAIGRSIAQGSGKRDWNVREYHGAWIKGRTAGGCGNTNRDLKWINPQYHIHLKDPDSADYEDKCTVIISLMEKGQQAGNKIAIGYDIYKVRHSPYRPIDEDENLSARELVHKDKYGLFQYYREVVKRFILPPGHYVIIPCTFQAHQEAEFLLRIYTERQATSEMINRGRRSEDPYY